MQTGGEIAILVEFMNTDEKILQALSALQADVTAMKGEVAKLPAIQKQLDQQGKIQAVLASNVATVLEEQQQQRTDIRSLHSEVHESEERQAKRLDEAKEEILATMQAGFQALRGEVGKTLKDHTERIEELEKEAGIPHPHKH